METGEGAQVPHAAERNVPCLPGGPEDSTDGERGPDLSHLREQEPNLSLRRRPETVGERPSVGD